MINDMNNCNYLKNDKVNREKLAEKLSVIVHNYELFKRDMDYKALTIAINAPWGSGKSYFLKYLGEYLVKNHETYTENKVIYYNAWQKDYWGNALDPLLQCLIKSDAFLSLKSRERDLKPMISMMLNIGKFLSINWIGKNLGTDSADLISLVADGENMEKIQEFLLNKQSSPFHMISELEKNIEVFVEFLNDLEKPIIFMVDELDRCKPVFAVQTLEVIKHIFDVKGVIFIFGIHLEQLGYSVSSIYGQGMNSYGYLQRLFDLVLELPYQEHSEFIRHKVISSNIDDRFRNIICDTVEELSEILGLSLRDIDQLIVHIKILFYSEFRGGTPYSVSAAIAPYINILCIKIKAPRVFNSLFCRGYERIIDENNNFTNAEMASEFRNFSDNQGFVKLPF